MKMSKSIQSNDCVCAHGGSVIIPCVLCSGNANLGNLHKDRFTGKWLLENNLQPPGFLLIDLHLRLNTNGQKDRQAVRHNATVKLYNFYLFS